MFDELGGAAGAGTSGGSQPPATPGGTGASPTPGGVVASPATSVVDQPVEHLRREYDVVKRERDQWAQLGKHEDVSRAHQGYTKLSTEAVTLGTQLGYSQEEVQQAFSNDPVGIIAFLRSKAQQAPSNQPQNPQDIQKLIQRQLKEHLKPFEQEREARLDKEAESRFDGQFEGAFKTHFPHGLPDSVKQALSGLAWTLVTDNPETYKSLREKGDVSGIGGAIEAAKKQVLQVVNDYMEHERKRTGDPGTNGRGDNGQFTKKKGMTLDDIIADPGVLGSRYAAR